MDSERPLRIRAATSLPSHRTCTHHPIFTSTLYILSLPPLCTCTFYTESIFTTSTLHAYSIFPTQMTSPMLSFSQMSTPILSFLHEWLHQFYVCFTNCYTLCYYYDPAVDEETTRLAAHLRKRSNSPLQVEITSKWLANSLLRYRVRSQAQCLDYLHSLHRKYLKGFLMERRVSKPLKAPTDAVAAFTGGELRHKVVRIRARGRLGPRPAPFIISGNENYYIVGSY